MFTRDIKHWILSLKDEEIFLAKEAYQKHFKDMKEATFYQLLARLNNEKYIGKIAKGLYYKPSQDFPSNLPSTEKLLNFFTNKYKAGMIVGTQLFKDLNLVEITSDTYQIYTNLLEIKTVRNMSNLQIQYVDIDYKNESLRNIIETLEVIEHIDEYENVKSENLFSFLKEHSKNYNEDDLFRVLSKKSYKKRVIATLKEILDYFNVENNLSRVLNTASRYSFPEKIKESLKI